jgi:hypothetical protein
VEVKAISIEYIHNYETKVVDGSFMKAFKFLPEWGRK